MAEIILENYADFDALYGAEDITFSTNTVSTTIITGITAVKAVDKEFWVNGPLNYTITVTNTSGEDLTNVLFRDYIDVAVAAMDDTFGIRVDGVQVTYTYMSGVIELTIPQIPSDGTPVTITFRVLQI